MSTTACEAKVRWREFISAEGEFAVLMPEPPDEIQWPADTMLGRGASEELHIGEFTMYSASVLGRLHPAEAFIDSIVPFGRGYYTAGFVDLGEKHPLPDVLLDLVITRMATRMHQLNAGIEDSPSSESGVCTWALIDESMTEGEFPGREVLFEEICGNPPMVFLYRQRFFVARERLYHLSAMGEKREDFQEALSDDADAFFESFRLLRR